MKLTVIWVLLAHVALSSGYAMSDVTHSVFSNNLGHNSNLAAFGDFNADKLVDIFALDKAGKEVHLLIAPELSTSPYMKLPNLITSEHPITSVVPGDFDGDTQMDVLVTWKSGNAVQVEIYWGENATAVDQDNPLKLNNTLFKDQPLVFDYNGDMIPDLLAETLDGKRVWAHANVNETKPKNRRNFIIESFPEGTKEPFRVPHSNSFVDVNRDYTADLVLTTEKNFEIWLSVEGQLTHNKSEMIEMPEGTENYIFGQSVWVDIDQNSEPDLILPACEDKQCKKSHLFVYHRNKWVDFTTMFSKSQETYGFVTKEENPAQEILQLDIHFAVHMGDFDMDGYPDMMILLKQIGDESNDSIAYIVMNEDCNNQECVGIGRKFTVLWDSEVSKVSHAMQATFFDIYEDGVLDILLVTRSTSNNEKTVSLQVYKNAFSADACFLKITVVSGLCNKDCPEGRTPYGVNQPGPSVKYETTKPNGAPTQGCATQLTQSAHFALQMPYTIFGLGQMPNFVDNLCVGIPRPPGTKEALTASWPQIIPNTQLIVIPHPTDQPAYWVIKLYVKPSEAIMITGAVLVGCLGVVAAILGGLHWRERKEDKEEKKQEAQKFHFDAM